MLRLLWEDGRDFSQVQVRKTSLQLRERHNISIEGLQLNQWCNHIQRKVEREEEKKD